MRSICKTERDGIDGTESTGSDRSERETPENIGVYACFQGFGNGGGWGTRTRDRRIMIPLLYQLS
jgi:hypothetical protein